MVVNSLLVLALALLFGFPGITADVQQGAVPVDESAYVEIIDAPVPLAGPQGNGTVGGTRPTGAAATQTVATPTPTPTPTPTAAPGTTAPATQPTVQPTTEPAAPTQTPESPAPGSDVTEEPPAEESPTQAPPTEQPSTEPPATEEPPAEEPAPVVLSVAQRLLERTYALLAQYNAAPTAKDKKAVLEAPNYSLGNDAFRTKLLKDMGGQWEQVEEEVVEATQYQQGKTLYAQVYMSGASSDFQPVVYATQNADRTGNQWATNLVYDEETATWMEYTKKHPYNDSRVGYGMTALNKEGSLETLQETMETDPNWQPVVVPEETLTDAPAADAPVETPPETPAP